MEPNEDVMGNGASSRRGAARAAFTRRPWERVVCFLGGIVLLGVALWFRAWDLEQVPGVNGDEAWVGVQAERMLRGQCVSARTPTGNPLNPFFLVPQVLLHAAFEPSFSVLRVPALVSGLLALALNFYLCRRAFGVRMAWLTTLIHAVLPINIAYSRFAWDASQSLLLTLPVIYAGVLAQHEPLRRRRWTAIGLACLGAAVLVHPTNVLAAPFLIIQLAVAWRDPLIARWKLPVVRRVLFPLLLVVLAAAAAGLLPRVAHNLGHAENYTAFVQRFADLFTGATVYEYIPGTLAADQSEAASATQIVLDALGIVLTGLTAFALLTAIRRGRSTQDLWFVAGWAASVGCFFMVAGPTAIAPHFERYAICLVAPTVLVVGRALEWWMRPTTRFSLATAPLLVALGAYMLATFKSQYFDEFNQHGGRSHLTFRTASVEPKQQAMDLIVRERNRNVPLLIQTSEWWLYWPLQYLAHAHDDVIVELRSPDDPRPLDQQSFDDLESWIVEFAGTEAGWRLEKAWAALSSQQAARFQRAWIRDASGRKLLTLVRLPAE
jgi:hypothetical protein